MPQSLIYIAVGSVSLAMVFATRSTAVLVLALIGVVVGLGWGLLLWLDERIKSQQRPEHQLYTDLLRNPPPRTQAQASDPPPDDSATPPPTASS